MADPKPAKKTDAPPATPPAAPPARPTTGAADRNRAPHERFWEAGQTLYQGLQQNQEEAQNRFTGNVRDQQQRLWKAQLDARRRSDELLNDYWNTVNRASAEDLQKVNQDATRRYQEGLLDIQGDLRKEWEDVNQDYQKSLADLQDTIQEARVKAFNAYKNACRRAWSEIDANALTCESLAAIGQSLFAGANAVGGCSTCS
jgi:hypothetical protein